MKRPRVIICALQEEGRYRSKEFVLNPGNSGEALVLLEQRCDDCSQSLLSFTPARLPWRSGVEPRELTEHRVVGVGKAWLHATGVLKTWQFLHLCLAPPIHVKSHVEWKGYKPSAVTYLFKKETPAWRLSNFEPVERRAAAWYFCSGYIDCSSSILLVVCVTSIFVLVLPKESLREEKFINYFGEI